MEARWWWWRRRDGWQRRVEGKMLNSCQQFKYSADTANIISAILLTGFPHMYHPFSLNEFNGFSCFSSFCRCEHTFLVFISSKHFLHVIVALRLLIPIISLALGSAAAVERNDDGRATFDSRIYISSMRSMAEHDVFTCTAVNKKKLLIKTEKNSSSTNESCSPFK